MNAKRAAAALDQNVEVAPRLRRLDHAETRAVSRNGKVGGVLRGDLEEDAAVGTAFIGLAGRVQKARSEFEAGRDTTPIADAEPQFLQARRTVAAIGEIGQ